MTSKKCVLPYSHVSINVNGQSRPCCISGFSKFYNGNNRSFPKITDFGFDEILGAKEYRQLRDEFEQNKTPRECEICSTIESSGGLSKRQISNQRWATQLLPGQIQIKSLDLRLGNLCNLKCVMCGPGESSKWQSELEVLAQNDLATFNSLFAGRALGSEKWYNVESKVWNTLEKVLPTVEHIYFAGGEPLLQPEHNWLLEKIIASNRASSIDLEYNTNLTTLTDSHLETWRKFRSVKVNVSLDGIAAINEYIRYPSSFETVEKNLHRLDKSDLNLEITVTYTVSMLNAFYLPEFVKWKLNSNFRRVHSQSSKGDFTLNIIVYPEFLNVFGVPDKFKNAIVDKNEILLLSNDVSSGFKKSVSAMHQRMLSTNTYTKELGQKRLEFISYIEKTRNLKFDRIFPELEAYFN